MRSNYFTGCGVTACPPERSGEGGIPNVHSKSFQKAGGVQGRGRRPAGLDGVSQ